MDNFDLNEYMDLADRPTEVLLMAAYDERGVLDRPGNEVEKRGSLRK